MSKILGIDYGTKRVGIALSDESKKVAFPFIILPNDQNFIASVVKLCAEEGVDCVVMGESLDMNGDDNIIMKKARIFSEEFSGISGIPVFTEQEFMTSVEAHRSAFKEQGKTGRQEVDASAAALILQRYLEKINNKQ